MAMKEGARRFDHTGRTPAYSPAMSDAEIAGLIARLHRNAAARTRQTLRITDSAELVQRMRAEREDEITRRATHADRG